MILSSISFIPFDATQGTEGWLPDPEQSRKACWKPESAWVWEVNKSRVVAAGGNVERDFQVREVTFPTGSHGPMANKREGAPVENLRQGDAKTMSERVAFDN
jgi:hypothetical protein